MADNDNVEEEEQEEEQQQEEQQQMNRQKKPRTGRQGGKLPFNSKEVQQKTRFYHHCAVWKEKTWHPQN